ncbi:MAG: hypothetical protein H8E19_01145 [Deltaproteobacteria bacterium]|uniref:Uncharacterized protein n=1 Tax=Candidatus Desulfacyla euxinica TaxID=2841693 RepID=A0A8J6MYB0_9DELT|nr:hypothetical protein [Candidatus Desulfacyla euxinica]
MKNRNETYQGYYVTKNELVEKIRELLKTDFDLSFLLQLKKKEVETLIACIRDRVDNLVK